jgi:riboflavin transporter
MHNKLSSRQLALCAALAAMSAVMQLLHFGFQPSQFGMWIDLVASSWIIAFFLFGFRGALLTSLVGAIIITLVAPETWIGAIMKWASTFPIILSFSMFAVINKDKLATFTKPSRVLLPLLLGLILRNIVALPLNYYFAIPIWTGMTSSKALIAVPWYLIVIFNTLQGLVDVILAWLITYKFKLIRFASWSH